MKSHCLPSRLKHEQMWKYIEMPADFYRSLNSKCAFDKSLSPIAVTSPEIWLSFYTNNPSKAFYLD